MAAGLIITYSVAAKIVGSQYHAGNAPTGTNVTLRREPKNPHDPLAIAVFDPHGRRAGYLPRATAQMFAALLDAGQVTLKGETTGASDGGEIPLRLFVSTHMALVDLMTHLLSAAGVSFEATGKGGNKKGDYGWKDIGVGNEKTAEEL